MVLLRWRELIVQKGLLLIAEVIANTTQSTYIIRNHAKNHVATSFKSNIQNYRHK